VKTTSAYTYHGEIIEHCERAPGEHRGRWIVRHIDRERRLVSGDEISAHYPTLAAAREAINDGIAVNEA
jgi:hypothetical protein